MYIIAYTYVSDKQSTVPGHKWVTILLFYYVFHSEVSFGETDIAACIWAHFYRCNIKKNKELYIASSRDFEIIVSVGEITKYAKYKIDILRNKFITKL